MMRAMSYIKKIGLDEASGRLKRTYDAGIRRAGHVAQIVQVMSLDPAVCDASIGFYTTLMKKENALESSVREMLATVVSNANDCYYWTLSHARDFGAESGNKDLAEKLVYDYRTANLPEEKRALCDYAVKLTKAPDKMSELDLEKLREHKWTDEQIHVATQIISYFNYINRIAGGLGVDNEDWMDIPEESWLKEKGSFTKDGWKWQIYPYN